MPKQRRAYWSKVKQAPREENSRGAERQQEHHTGAVIGQSV
jgi:hypothetical protein